MALQFKTSLRTTWCDAITSAIGASGLLKIFTGAPPADCATADSGTQLAGLVLNATFAPGAVNGVLTLNSITGDASADNTGTAGYWRMYTSGAVCIMQGLCGTSGSDLNLTTLSIVATQPVNVTSWVITAPGA